MHRQYNKYNMVHLKRTLLFFKRKSNSKENSSKKDTFFSKRKIKQQRKTTFQSRSNRPSYHIAQTGRVITVRVVIQKVVVWGIASPAARARAQHALRGGKLPVSKRYGRGRPTRRGTKTWGKLVAKLVTIQEHKVAIEGSVLLQLTPYS